MKNGVSFTIAAISLATSLILAMAGASVGSTLTSPGTVSLMPIKDNTLYEDGTGSLSNGAGAHFFAGTTGSNLMRRGLIAFDLSSVPANATISSATLSLFLSQGQGVPHETSVSRVLQDWGEGSSNAGSPGGGGAPAQTGDATWIHTFYNTGFWTNAGGDFSATPSATTTVSALNTTYAWSGSEMVADVQGWVSNPTTNFGWIVRGAEQGPGAGQRFNSRENSSNPPQLTITYQLPTPTTTPSPTVSISGTISYCSNPVPGPVPNVVLNLTGDATASVMTNGSGNYQFAAVAAGGNYTVTPSKPALSTGAPGINTVDVVATQRHFLNITLLSGCRLSAADVNGDTNVNTVDVIAIQRFFLSFATGTANVGKFSFGPPSRAYPGVVTDQTGQDFNALIFGDVATPFAQ